MSDSVAKVEEGSISQPKVAVNNPSIENLLAEDAKEDDVSSQVAKIIGNFGRWQFAVVLAIQSMAYTSIAFHILVRNNFNEID